MQTYVAFLRAVNVGGTGKLPMSELRRMCVDLGYTDVQTYIASGNVVFRSNDAKRAVKKALEQVLGDHMGKEAGVVIRTAPEIRAVLESNPFAEADGSKSVAILLDRKPTNDALGKVTGQSDEEISIGVREFYVYFPQGMGRSKLRIAAAKHGTTRNMNTIRKMVELSSD